MKTSIPGDILLFGGQGSKQHLSDRGAVAELERNLGEAKPLFKLFLQQCLEAFYSECGNLTEKERTILGRDPSDFYENSEALLFPSEAIRSHPITETISLYIRQILELAVFAAQSDVYPRIIEVTGVCTGLIPAVLAASTLSYESEEFFGSALHGFRLAFYVGLRSVSVCYDLLDSQPQDSGWVLSTFGWPTGELEAALSEFRSQQQQELGRMIQVSAIFDDGVHSLSGPGHILSEFRSKMVPPSIQCRIAHVHGFYHGGSSMDAVVEQVLDNVKSRRINFPTWDTLHAPLRSSTTGARMIKGSSHQSLLETVLRSIFVEVCDWKKTRDELLNETIKYLTHDPKAEFRVLCVGPGARSLVQGVPTHDRLRIIDNLSVPIDDNTRDMIAIVGMSLNYPGADSRDQLWDMLENARSTASKIPSLRFDTSAKLENRFGNFLEDPFQFDPGFFNISPREAKSMDPQQRLLLQAAFEALEDSGYSPNSTPTFQKDSFGVFVGVATGDYVDNLRQDIDVYYSPGTLRAFLSGRISYAFDFLGPSMVVDTACSSSLVALYQACRALQSGECTAAIAGGVNTISSPDMYSGLGRAHFLSPTGQCKPFDAAADGYCRAEGCGLVVVKRLSSAIEENDKIYGVIRGIGINQCGTAKSITHPDHSTQAALFKQVLISSRTAPDTISVVEAHGTGTQAGDYAEIQSLNSAFGPRSRSNPLYLSSIKGNIGHAEAASGLAGLGKLLTMMHKGAIPPQASFKTLNPRLQEKIHNTIVPTQLTKWERLTNGAPRRAMLNNFGAAGSNAALILEEYVPNTKASSTNKGAVPDRSHHVLNISAKSERSLQLLRDRMIAHIEANPQLSIADLCYTMNARRQVHTGFRLSATGSNLTQLANSLRQSSPSQNDSKKGPRKSIFVFSGQGHAQKGMGAEMFSTVPGFRLIVDNCDKILSENGFPVVGPFLSGSTYADVDEYTKNEVAITQCALFTLEYALASTWIKWGLAPDIVVGHSIGEYAAMAIAGILDVKDALLLTAKRAKLITTKCVEGMSGMVTCRSTVDIISPLLEKDDLQFSGLSIACLNSHEDIVVAGPSEPLARFVEYCNRNGIKAKKLKVPYGFHSPCMDPILEDLEACASAFTTGKTDILLGSSLQGKLLDPEEKVQADYFVQHTRSAVNFHSVVRDIERSFPGVGLDFIEIGPFPTTESMIRRTIEKSQYTFLPSLKPTESSWETLSRSLSSLFLRNHAIKWRDIYNGLSAKPLESLPKYPLNTAQYYVRFQDQPVIKSEPREEIVKPAYEFLDSAPPTVSGELARFQTNLTRIAPYIKAHSVAGVPLCPASVLMEVVLEALSVSQGESNTSLHLLEDIVFEKPLVYADNMTGETSLQTELDMDSGKRARFSLSSKNQLHCSGIITRKSLNEVIDTFARKSAFVKRLRATPEEYSGPGFDSFSPKTIYQVIFPRVVAYSEPFLTLKQLFVSESRLEGCGKFQIDGSLLQDKFICHPAFLDTLLHAPGFIANIYVPADVACICVGVESAYVPPTQDLTAGEMTIYCSLTDLGHSVIADAYVIDSNDKIVAFIEGSCFKKIPLKSFNNHLSRTLQASLPKAHPTKAPLVRATPAEGLPIKAPIPTRKALNPSPSHVEETIRSIVQECCGVYLDPSSSITLVEAGVDSLMLIEITQMIRSRLPQIEINDASLDNYSTLREFTSILSAASAEKPFPKIPTPDLTRQNSPKIQDVAIPRTPTPNDLEFFSPIKELIFETCGIQIEAGMMDLELATLGVDSLLSIELGDVLRERFGFVLDDSQHNIPELTFNQLEKILDANLRTPSDTPKSPESQASAAASLVTIPTPENAMLSPPGEYNFQRIVQQQTSGPPKSGTYLFHDGSGHCSMYSRISNLNRNITGVFSPDLSTDIDRLEDLASLYIKRTSLYSEQEVVLGGWSFGGVLAFEVSRQLRALGRTVKGLILIDSPPPVDHKALPEEIIAHILGGGGKAAGNTTPAVEASNQARERIRQRFLYHAKLLQNYHPEPRAENVPCVMLKCSRSMDTETLCNVAYPWISDDEFRAKTATQWEQLMGRNIPVLDIACNHFQVFDAEYVEDVSRKLMLACEMLD
ncbi:putative polyketide synthase [Rosellinia necatrix]|uniref:Putative polyketide synthase n=1 Tax=Rosellinia necatrix TaxID=77044 RepID=A0A1S7UHP4_ROSNE|nr:putative polyketide synthase [Rosellinia necatrix]